MYELIKQSLNSIKIKYKLLILLALPFICFFVLAVIEVSEQYDSFNSTKRIEYYHKRSAILLEVLVSLQKERGYIHAYSNTQDESFKKLYLNHQSSVNNAIDKLKKELAGGSRYIEVIDNQFDELSEHLGAIDDIRAQLALNISLEDLWQFYTEAIRRIIRIHQWLGVEQKDPQLINQYYAFLSLWNLIELAGKERGLTYESIGSGRINADIYRQLNANFEQQQKASEEIRQLAEFPGNEHLFSVLKLSSRNSPINQLRQRIQRKVAKSEIANRLLSHMGYGGMIHAFKNYLIRGDEESLAAFHHHYKLAVADLELLDTLSGASDSEQYDVHVIRDTLNAYSVILAVIERAHSDQMPVDFIDEIVSVDDTQALEAIDRIIGPAAIDPHRWFDLSTARIDQIAVTTSLLGEEIHRKVTGLCNEAYNALILWAAGAALLFIASLALSVAVSRHFVSRIGALNKALKYIIESYDFSHRIPESGGDEIGQTKQQFNRLIGHLEHQYEVEEQQRAELELLVTDLKAKQSIIDQEEEIARQVFEKVTQAGKHNNPNVHFWNKPMTGFSGDLLMSVESKTGFTYVMMCDFTGHGLPAALGAIPVSLVFYPMAKNDVGIPEIVSEINDKLLNLLPTAFFCCAAIMVLDRSHKSCIFWNGGLPPLLHYDSEGELKASLEGGHLPLGIAPYAMKDTIPQEILLEPGDSIYAYTDGLTEADNPDGEMFNESRLLAALSTPSNNTSRIPLVRNQVEGFMAEAPASDDISIIELVA